MQLNGHGRRTDTRAIIVYRRETHLQVGGRLDPLQLIGLARHRVSHGRAVEDLPLALAADFNAQEGNVKGARVGDSQIGLAVVLPERPLQVLEAQAGVFLELRGAMEHLDPRAQGDIQHVGFGAVGLGDFLDVKEEQRFAIGGQVIGQTIDLHLLLLAWIQAEQRRRGNKRYGGGGVVALGIDPGLHGISLLAGIADDQRGAALVAGKNHTRAVDTQGRLAGGNLGDQPEDQQACGACFGINRGSFRTLHNGYLGPGHPIGQADACRGPRLAPGGIAG